jgi:hypothetical protein
MRLLKVRGDIDGVELVKVLLIDGCHLTSNLAGLFLTEGESKFRRNNLPEIRGKLLCGTKCTNLGLKEWRLTLRSLARSLRTSS